MTDERNTDPGEDGTAKAADAAEPEDADPGPGAVIEGPDAEPDTDETAPRNDEVKEA